MSIKTITEYHDKEETKLKSEIQKDTETGLITSKLEYDKEGVKTFFGLYERTNPKDGSRFFEREDTVMGSKVRSPATGKIIFERELKIEESYGLVLERMYDNNGNQTREMTKNLAVEIEKHENGNIKRIDYGNGKVKDQFGLKMPLVSLLFDKDGILENTLIRDITTGELNNINVSLEDEYPASKYEVNQKGNEINIKEKGSNLLKVRACKKDYGLFVEKNQFITSDNKVGFETEECPFFKNTYNPENGEKIKNITYANNNKKIISEFTNLGKLKESKHYEGVSTHPYLIEKYEHRGIMLTGVLEYDKEGGHLIKKTNIEYEDDLLSNQKTHTYYKNNLATSTVQENYNKLNQIKDRTVFKEPTGEFVKQEKFQFNNEGAVVLESVRTTESFTVYDKEGNVIENPEINKEDLEKLGIKKQDLKRGRRGRKP